MIYAIRTTSGREDIVIDIMNSNVRSQNLPVKAIVHPAEIKGYVFAEGSSGAIHKAVQGLMHVRGIIEKPIQLEEIKHFLELKKDRIRVEEGNVVEIIGGPFRGEKGKITRVDAVKDEVTIELLDASIPIPVTIATEFIKILKRETKEEEEPEEKPREEVKAEPPPEEAKEEEPKEAKEEQEESVFDKKPEEPEEAREEKTGEEKRKEIKEDIKEYEEKLAEEKPEEKKEEEPEKKKKESEEEKKE